MESNRRGQKIAPYLLPESKNPLRHVLLQVLGRHQFQLPHLVVSEPEREVFGPNDHPMNCLKKRGLVDFQWIDREAGRGRWALSELAKTIIDSDFCLDGKNASRLTLMIFTKQRILS